MNDSPPPSRKIEASAAMPLSKVDETLLESFAQDVAAQAARLDDLAKQIITLGLAVPGIYAAVLKLVSGDKATLDNPWLLLIAFIVWMLALGLALSSLLPVKREVDQDSLSDIQRYFSDSARHKWRLLALACILSFFGICFAVLGIFI